MPSPPDDLSIATDQLAHKSADCYAGFHVTQYGMAKHSHPYFRDARLSILDGPAVAQLGALAEQVISKQLYSTYERTWEDHARFYVDHDHPIIQKINGDCLIECRAFMMMFPPNITMPVHTDANYADGRLCAIATPLYPDAITPTHWYAEKDGLDVVATAHWRRYRSKVLNVQTWHGLSTEDSWRVMLQISLPLAYDQVIDLIERKQLWRTASCTLLD